MTRRPILPVVAVALLAGCHRVPAAAGPAPDIVAIAVSTDNVARFRAIAARCGARSAALRRAGEAMLLVVGRDSSIAARDCFFNAARDEHRRTHPVRAWIEDRIG